MNKFDTLLESTRGRYTQGGLLVGDLVKVKKEALTSEWAKKQAGNLIEKLREFIETPLNVRVSAVKALRPAVSGSIQAENQVDDYYCDIVIETAPGLYATFITLPINLLEYLEQDDNLARVPDEFKQQSPDGNPNEVEIAETDDPIDAAKQTQSKQGDKTLPTKQTKLDHTVSPVDNFNTNVYLQGLR